MKIKIAAYVAFCVALLFIVGCAASKVAKNSPAGTWNYTVKNTPEGNLSGTMDIQRNGEGYTGKLSSSHGSVDLNNVTIEDNQLFSSFYMQGTSIQLKGAFSGDTFTGSVDTGGQSFPIEATRTSKE